MFYERGRRTGIYQYFRAGAPLRGVIQKPTGGRDHSFELEGSYSIVWNDLRADMKYTIVEIGQQEDAKRVTGADRAARPKLRIG